MEALKQAIALLQGGGQVTAEQLLALLNQAMTELAGAAPPPPPGDTPAAPPPQTAPPPPKADAKAKEKPVDEKKDAEEREAFRTKILADARAHANDRAALLRDAGEILDTVDMAMSDDDLRASIVLAVMGDDVGGPLLTATTDSAYVRALCDSAVATHRARRSTGRVLDSRRIGDANDPIKAIVDRALDPWAKPAKTEGKAV